MTDGAHDPFETLGLDPSFTLERGAVAGAYASRVAAIHPDLADPDAREQAERLSARLNDARATLDDPERRAIALLARLGGPGASEDRSLPDGFLMEMMETREQAEQECATREGHERWRAWASARREVYVAEVGALFERAFSDGQDAATLTDIRRVLNAWRYIERMIEQLDPGAHDPM